MGDADDRRDVGRDTVDGGTVDRSTGGTSLDDPIPDGEIRLLHVEDDAAFVDLTREYLSRLAPGIDHTSVPSVERARDLFEPEPFDVVVCDHDLPDGTGIDVLEHVRDVDTEFPFILFTGKGSEEIASRAISAGVTDYIQKHGGTDRYEVLANRVHNAVERYRLTRQVERGIAALEAASEPIGILDDDGTYLFANEAYASVYGLDPADLVGTHWERLYPDDEVERFSEDILPTLTTEGYWHGRAIGRHVDGTRVRERLALTHTADGGHVCIIRDTESVSEPADQP
ncbi:response regulator [Halorubrum sp. DTA98]|uniref:response regulator n=1 Tax=Halorubrum sp. DTA98 TaxID=3402163 RepID=UPI003AB01F1E